MSAVLRTRGCEVLTPVGPDEAVQVATSHPGPIHALVWDVAPGLPASDASARIVARRPGIRVLYMSDGAIPGGEALGPRSAFLAKPFSPAALASRLDELLKRPPG
jgi:CheY-like chemotaxis protein